MNDFVILIPYYNDKQRIYSTLEKILKWKIKNNILVKVYIIDDGSDKNNKIELKKKYEDNNFFYLEKKHSGMIDTIVFGFSSINANNYVIISSDMPVHIDNINQMKKYLNTFEIIQGSRFANDKNDKKKIIKRSIDRKILTTVLCKLNSLLYNHGIKDTQIDFKIINKKIIENVIPDLKLKHDGMKMTEIIVRSYAYGYKIFELPTEYIDNEKSVTLSFNFLKVHLYLLFVLKAVFAYFMLYFIILKEKKLSKSKIKINPLRKLIK